jgi:hypothetical protein
VTNVLRSAGAHAGSTFATGAWLAIGIALGCLLTAGGGMTSMDGVVAFNVTQNLIEKRSVATSGGVIELEPYRGRDGRFYSPFGIAQSIWNIPFYLAGRAVAALLPARIGRSDTVPKAVVTLGTIPAVALLAWICFALLVRLGAEPSRAAGAGLLLVFATPLWPHSGFGFNQPHAGMFLWLAVLGAVAGVADGANRRVLTAAGLAAGGALLTRHEMVLPAAVIAVWLMARPRSCRWTALFAYLAGFMPAVVAWGMLNWWRFGHPLETGYLRDPTPGYGSSIVAGATGLLFSPYSSVFLYCPVALLGLVALPALWRRNRSTAILVTAVFVSSFLFYSSLSNWMGARSYGPRYLVPFLPALVLPLAFWRPPRACRWIVAAIIGLSVAVQIPGVLVDYSKVREARAAEGDTVAQDMRWSGMPLRLNALAVARAIPRTIRHLSGREQPPSVRADDPALSRALSFSLDLWWLHLFYLGVLGPFTALMIGGMIGVAAVLAIVRALRLARDTAAAGA